VYALLRVVIKEFLQLRQDRKMIPVMIVGPLAQLLALGYAANLDVNSIPIVLVDEDRTAESRSLVERFTGSGYFDLVGSEDTAARVDRWLVDGRAQVALVIAAGYGDAAASGHRPRVQAIADGTDATHGAAENHLCIGFPLPVGDPKGLGRLVGNSGELSEERVRMQSADRQCSHAYAHMHAGMQVFQHVQRHVSLFGVATCNLDHSRRWLLPRQRSSIHAALWGGRCVCLPYLIRAI
jgi:hypothetical protein